MRLGIIGCGRFAEKRVLPAAQEANIQVTAISRRNQDEGERIARKWNIKHVCATPQDLLPHVDAVWITSPHDLHEHDALVCAEARIPTLCEKPLALTVESAKRMEKAFQNTPLLLGHYLRYKFAVQKSYEMIEANALGPLQHIKAHYSIPLDPSSWRYKIGGVIQDLGVHLIDLARYFARAPTKKVFGQGNEKSFHLFLEFETGVTAQLSCSFCYAFASSFEIFGTQSRLISTNSLRHTLDPVETFCHIKEDDGCYYFPLRAENPYVNQLRHFIDVVKKKTAPLVSAQDGVEIAHIIKQAQSH